MHVRHEEVADAKTTRGEQNIGRSSSDRNEAFDDHKVLVLNCR
jgi:hypothetical protein